MIRLTLYLRIAIETEKPITACAISVLLAMLLPCGLVSPMGVQPAQSMSVSRKPLLVRFSQSVVFRALEEGLNKFVQP